MRAYTLSVLQKLAGSSQPIKDSEIVDWTNTTLAEAGKSSSITGFKDPAITTSMPVIDLIDAIKPGAIKYELVGSGTSDEVRTYKNYNWNPTFSDIPHYLQCCRSHESEGGLDAQKNKANCYPFNAHHYFGIPLEKSLLYLASIYGALWCIKDSKPQGLPPYCFRAL